MILKTLYLKLEDRQASAEEAYAFLKASRYLCNYLEREVLKPLRFQCEGFNRIVVVAKPDPQNEVFVNSSQVACVDVAFERSVYSKLSEDARTEYFIDLLRDGLAKCAAQQSVPFDELMHGIDSFVAGGMKNEWIFTTRQFRQPKLKASLKCSLTAVEFQLRLQVWRSALLVVDEVILRTDPDEIAFHYRFDDVRIVDGAMTVTNRFGAPVLWSRSLTALETDSSGDGEQT